MKSYRFATAGRLGKEFKTLIDNYYPNFSCTYFESEAALLKEISDFDAYAGFSINPAVDISHLEWIHSFGAGVNAFMQLNLSASCMLTRTAGHMGVRMAEYCLAYIFHEYKSIDKVRANQQAKNWTPLLLKDLSAANTIIYGTGNIGSAVGQKLSPLVSRVDGVNLSRKKAGGFDKTYSIGDKMDLSIYDIVINTLPLTKSTMDLFHQDLFRQFRNVLFINVGRGQSVNQEALLHALNREHVSKAILDVFEQEPLPVINPLWNHAKVIITPHHASKTTAEDVSDSFKKIIDAQRAGITNDLFVDIKKGY